MTTFRSISSSRTLGPYELLIVAARGPSRSSRRCLLPRRPRSNLQAARSGIERHACRRWHLLSPARRRIASTWPRGPPRCLRFYRARKSAVFDFPRAARRQWPYRAGTLIKRSGQSPSKGLGPLGLGASRLQLAKPCRSIARPRGHLLKAGVPSTWARALSSSGAASPVVSMASLMVLAARVAASWLGSPPSGAWCAPCFWVAAIGA